MDDSMELSIKELAGLLGLSPSVVYEWTRQSRRAPKRPTKRPLLKTYVPYGNPRMGRWTTVGDVRAYLASLEADQGHALRRFEAALARAGDSLSQRDG